MATRLTDALKAAGRAMRDHDMAAAFRSPGQRRTARAHARCRRVQRSGHPHRPANGNPDEEWALRGEDYVRHLVRIAREIPEIPGEPPRLYVVTRNAQTVLPGDVTNLEQAGLRGLMRVIGTEYPHLRATQIDMDEETEAEQLAQQLLGGSEEDETAWRNGQWHTARLSPARCAPRSGEPPWWTTRTTACACRSARPVTWKRWNWPRSTGSAGAGRDRGRGDRIQPQLRRCPRRLRPVPGYRRGCATARYGFCRRGDRGRSGRDRSSGR